MLGKRLARINPKSGRGSLYGSLELKCKNFVLIWGECVNMALRRFLHNHDNIATEWSPKPGLSMPYSYLNDFEGSS